MKIIEGSQSLTKNQPRFVEVGDKILMNGAVYNFEDFTPVPYNWCQVDCQAYQGNRIAYNNNYMVSYSTRSENATWCIYGEPYYLNTGAYDTQDSTIYYKATESNSSDSNKNSTLLSKLKIIDGKVTTVRTVNLALNNIQIIGQDNEYIFTVGYKLENSTTNYDVPPMATYYYAIKKDTLVATAILNGNGAHINCSAMGPAKLLKETSDYIVLVQSTNAYTNNTSNGNNRINGDIHIVRVDKVARTVQKFKNTHIEVLADGNNAVAITNEYDNFLMRDANRYMIYQAMWHQTEDKVKLHYNLVNIASNFISTELILEHKEEVEIDWDGAEDSIIEKFEHKRIPQGWDWGHTHRYRFVYNKCMDKTYLTLIHYRTAEPTSVPADKYTGACAFTFTMNAYGNLKFESYTDLPKLINAFLSLDNEGKRMYAIDNSNLYYIEFNESSKKLEVVTTNNLIPTSVGVDTAGRTWVITTNGDVHMFNDNVSAKVSLAFKDAAYDYVGEEIDTSIILSCTNVFGTKISTDMELEIRGNAYFKLTGSKKVSVTTLPLTDTEVSIAINGPGQLSIIPKVIL